MLVNKLTLMCILNNFENVACSFPVSYLFEGKIKRLVIPNELTPGSDYDAFREQKLLITCVVLLLFGLNMF